MKTNDLKRQLAAVMAVALTFSSVPAVSVGAVSGLNHDGETVVEGESLTFTYSKDNAGNNVTLSSSNEAVKKQRPKSRDFPKAGNLGSFNAILQKLTINT